MRHFAILTALTLSACAPSGHVYEVGNFVRPHPTPTLCASRGQVLDMTIEDCVVPGSSRPEAVGRPALEPGTGPSAPVIAAAAYSDQGETYEQDRAWTERLEHGACSRLRDRRTDLPADIAECHRDNATRPPCFSYKGFAYAWFDLAENPVPGGVSTVAFQTDVINNLGSTNPEDAAPYERSPQFRDMLHRLLSVTFSPNRKKWGSTREQFSDYAYKICMERRPF
jgi:hypothetical protein